ncbi:hypothetical protein ACFX2I_024599 [Malus domestica]
MRPQSPRRRQRDHQTPGKSSRLPTTKNNKKIHSEELQRGCSSSFRHFHHLHYPQCPAFLLRRRAQSRLPCQSEAVSGL